MTVIGYTPGPTEVPATGDCAQVSGPQLSVAQVRAGKQRSGMEALQLITVICTGNADEFVTQAQFSVGGIVSTIVTVWVHWSWFPQSSIACQVRVMTSGQVPFVTVLMTVTITPLLGVPGGGEQLLVQ